MTEVAAAVTTYESPSRIGPPLLYTTTSEVTLQRPIDAPPINREILSSPSQLTK